MAFFAGVFIRETGVRMKISRLLRQLDVPLVLFVIALAVISIVAISGATYTIDPVYLKQQIYWYGLGILLLAATLLFDYRVLAQGRFVYLLYGFGLFLLVLVMIPGVGTSAKGAQQWLKIGAFQFQPSEFMKLFLIILLAKVTSEVKRLPIRDWKTLGKLSGLFALPFFLVLIQPDLGTALVLLGIAASVLLVAGLDWRIILAGLSSVTVLVGGVLTLYFTDHPLLHTLLQDHQIERIETFVNPASDPSGAGYQLTQSMIAVGSGQLSGKGFHNGTQAQGKWIPEPHNDFIFAVFAEEFGFIGGSLLLCTFIFLLYRMVKVGLQCEERFGAYIVAGVIGMIVFQVFQNIGMTVGILPITGLPLPFISYGGSALLMEMVAIGLVLNIGMRRNDEFLFRD
ncbi:rod shape-determining protein RodA [Paludifilum halophilum]|uniref:Peptidoglycan glycosyltransferase RodA n=1 Tax=Paludifilum halophilum TaxID=1642702 RepID=A0A235B6U5_9BACL|nr:rod shape-determining protein RodA [Paludifilum halophilum]OYD07709.1 rod shape-determining protein RodA [Paludifilum halophilum]